MRIERRGEEEREQKEAAGIERDVGKETESECLVILQFVPKGFVPPPACLPFRSLRKSAHAIASPPPSIAKVKFCTCAKCARAESASADGGRFGEFRPQAIVGTRSLAGATSSPRRVRSM